LKERYPTKKIFVGDVAVGGDAPISIQSMTFSETSDVDATVEQINRLHFAGADMVRVVYRIWSRKSSKDIRSEISLPLICRIYISTYGFGH